MVFTWYWSIFKIASFRVSALDGFKTTAWCLRESIFSRSRGKKESYTKIILNDTKYTYAYIYLVFRYSLAYKKNNSLASKTINCPFQFFVNLSKIYLNHIKLTPKQGYK